MRMVQFLLAHHFKVADNELGSSNCKIYSWHLTFDKTNTNDLPSATFFFSTSENISNRAFCALG